MKNAIPTVACINDLSGFGRCSLTVALPILSVMGMQACPLPTAVLSAHTEYPHYSFLDLTANMREYYENWQKLGLGFEAVYSGFLGSVEQIALVERIFANQTAETLRLTDPVMADNGRRYDTCGEELCRAMKRLVAAAQVVTPNITEACLLTDTPYQGEHLSESAAAALCRAVSAIGAPGVVLTGIRAEDDRIGNGVYEADGDRFTIVYTPMEKRQRAYAGTGDVFASVLCGGLMRGETLLKATERAAAFVAAAAAYTARFDTRREDGLLFERLLADGELLR